MLSIHRLTTAGVTAALFAALAIALAMSAPAAPAKPVDAHHIRAHSQATWGSFESIDPNRSTADRSDVRSPDASDAAGNARKQDLRHLRAGGHPVNAPGATAVDSATQRSLPGPPMWPVNPQPIADASPVHASDGGGLGTAIVFGIVVALAISAATAIRLRRLRIRRRRAAHAAT